MYVSVVKYIALVESQQNCRWGKFCPKKCKRTLKIVLFRIKTKLVLLSFTQIRKIVRRQYCWNKLSLFRYDIMVRCWNFNPDFRPPFENLRQRMDSYIRDTVCYDFNNNWRILINVKKFRVWCPSIDLVRLFVCLCHLCVFHSLFNALLSTKPTRTSVVK